MKKTAITALIMLFISISVLQAQSDFGPKKHSEFDPVFSNTNSLKENHATKTVNSYSLPFTENFEDLEFPPNNWTTFIGTNGAGTNYNWTLNYGYNDYCAFVDWEDLNGTECQDWLVTPLISLGENTTLTFHEKQSFSVDYNSEYYIMVSTNSQTNHSDFSIVNSYNETDFSYDWSIRTIDLSAFDNQDVYIAFVMFNDDGDSWYVDNVSIIDDQGGGGTAGGDLLISEVAYPIDYEAQGRFIELYNSGDQEIDLEPYYLAFYKNTNRINLSGTISAGETYLYAPDNDDFYTSYGFYPDMADGGISSDWFNGTDAIYLLNYNGKGAYKREDAYGVKKVNGDGTEWDYQGMHAVRDPLVTEYQKNFDISEWEISSAYVEFRDVTPGNHNDIYYWNGNFNDEWDEYRNWTVNTGFQAIPDAGSNVIIPSGTSNNASLSYYEFPYFFNSLTVENGASFSMLSYNILQVQNDVNVESGGNLYIKSDENGAAAFIPKGSVSGDINIERWFPTIGGSPTNGEWHYFTPSVTNMTSDIFTDQYLMYWDEPTTYWQYITETDYTLIPGLGYGVLLQESYGNTINFNGNIVNSDVQTPVLNNTNGSGWQGWNLIGNPFTASLDWEKVVSGLPAGVDVSIHYWDGENDQYVFYNNGSGTATQYIPPMQGFFIHTNNDNLQFTIPASARTYVGKDEFYKKNNGKPYVTHIATPREHNNRLIISASSEYNKTDKTFLEFHSKATEEFDFEFDALKFQSNNDSIPEPYFLYNSTKYAINTLPEELIDGRYDLCLNFGQETTFTLNFDGIESFNESQPILLYDKLTNDYYDIRDENNISFYNDPNNPVNRFEIIFDNWLGIDEINPANWIVYNSNGNLNIKQNIQDSNNNTIYYQLLSMDGKLISEGKFVNHLLDKSFQVTQSIYIVKIIDDNKQSTHKVILH